MSNENEPAIRGSLQPDYSHHRSSRCGVCYWALYDGDWCQNPKCVMKGKSVNDNRVLLTNEEARILIEANEWRANP